MAGGLGMTASRTVTHAARVPEQGQVGATGPLGSTVVPAPTRVRPPPRVVEIRFSTSPPLAPLTSEEAAWPRRHKVKRTYQPNNRRRAKRHGFRHRMRTRAGRAIVRTRRQKGRARLSA